MAITDLVHSHVLTHAAESSDGLETGSGTGVNEFGNRQDAIDAEAAQWVARLGGKPLTEAERGALDRWLARDPRHAAALGEAQAAWSRMDEVALDPEELARDIPPAPSMPLSRVSWVRTLAAAACLLIVVAGAGLWFGDPTVMLAADHQTAPGERRLVTLPDASTVELGPASALAVRYSNAERRVELLAGLA